MQHSHCEAGRVDLEQKANYSSTQLNLLLDLLLINFLFIFTYPASESSAMTHFLLFPSVTITSFCSISKLPFEFLFSKGWLPGRSHFLDLGKAFKQKDSGQ